MPIFGDGVAACCCAHILGTGVESTDRARVPALIVGEATQRLVADVFGRDDVFQECARIERRVVAWGGEPVELPHRAVVIAEDELVARLRPRAGQVSHLPGDWRVYGAGREHRLRTVPAASPAECVEQHFGTRMATVSPVIARGDGVTLWIESLPEGWLFLLPGWLLAVGGDVGAMLAQSGLIAPRIVERGHAGAAWTAHPRISVPLSGGRWLNCGAAAMGFDPICGDGTGYAVREGILAAAVVRGALAGQDEVSLREHYEARVIAGFRRHLELCRAYYRTGGISPWWHAELEALERGIAWCGADPEFRYRLNGFELQRLAQS